MDVNVGQYDSGSGEADLYSGHSIITMSRYDRDIEVRIVDNGRGVWVAGD